MFSTFMGLGLSLVTSAIIIFADYSIKIAAEGEDFSSRPMAFGVGLYVFSAVIWFFTMRHISLGQAAVAYSMFSLIGLFVVGVWVFGETAEWRDMAGIGCALVAMALMLRWL
ncbi:hypothetical protein [Pseudooceanicola onchidii]|uniref:hypothetical protein n=1 Tax=Pseudooceanicola onchidii TaxID=2562279 RepID=UPI0010A9CAB3|nr:hypothetical protein [Pseudooceanicola onchidii]